MLQLFPDESETIVGVAQQLRNGQTTSRHLVERCLERIDEWENEVHAWVSVDRDRALNQARELDGELRAGKSRGPLHGAPLGIKDIINIEGLPTAAGAKRLAATRATEDATIVRKLREAGAVILGKTVTTQFACFDPPSTRNPWNLEHTPGGSSSGSAAAVAAGMCFGAIGSQTGGSITRPAAYCGAAGCKPSYGRVSLAGIVPLAPSMDHPGPIARCVRDLAAILDVIAGYDSKDPHSVAISNSALDLREATFTQTVPPRFGRLRGFFEARAEPSMRSAFETALSAFRRRGASIEEIELPPTFLEIHREHRTCMAFQLASYHRKPFAEHREDYLPNISSLIEEGLLLSKSDYEASRRHQERSREEILSAFRDVDVLVCPAAPGPAPDLSTTGDPSFNSPWSHTGLPTVCVPISLTSEGLPLGIQIVGRPFDERRLFQATLWCESILRADHHR